jgi:hypothetical protein
MIGLPASDDDERICFRHAAGFDPSCVEMARDQYPRSNALADVLKHTIGPRGHKLAVVPRLPFGV